MNLRAGPPLPVHLDPTARRPRDPALVHTPARLPGRSHRTDGLTPLGRRRSRCRSRLYDPL